MMDANSSSISHFPQSKSPKLFSSTWYQNGFNPTPTFLNAHYCHDKSLLSLTI